MNPRIDQLVKTLLQKDSLDLCSLPELKEYAERHPYFGAAQLLLAKKLQKEQPDQYEEQLQKTFLFFHNPLWVEHLLSENGQVTTNGTKKHVTVEEENEVEIQQATVTEETNEIATPADTITNETAGKINAAATIEPLAPKKEKEELLFEPYYTVDYFASQGIAMKDDEKPKDKFGQQLKSFTEWLKMMKKLPVAEIIKEEPVAEKKVEAMAASSLEEKEIVTETMAEVWEKQGNMSKAIDIYSKLSLLEPSKSAYFAAKIEALRKSK